MKIDAKSKSEYFSKVGDRALDLEKIDKLILKYCASMKPVVFSGMSGSWLGYGMVPYKTKSMREASEWPLLALAAQKNHLALYVCVVVEGEYLAEKYQSSLGKVSCGKSCIRFKKYEDINETVLIKMLNDIEKRHKAGELLYGS